MSSARVEAQIKKFAYGVRRAENELKAARRTDVWRFLLAAALSACAAVALLSLAYCAS